MARFVTVLIGQAHQRLLGFALWSGVLLLILVGGAMFGVAQIDGVIKREGDRAVRRLTESSEGIVKAIALMDQRLTMAPCSPEFRAALRQIAYLPDGINVLLYVEDGKIICSADEQIGGLELGQPDFSDNTGAVYFNKDLRFLGILDTGTILLKGNYGVVVPRPNLEFSGTVWLRQSYGVMLDGKLVHRSGDADVTQGYQEMAENPSVSSILDGRLYHLVCSPVGGQCIIGRGDVYAALTSNLPIVAVWIAISAILALAISDRLHGLIRRFWSFEARFLRHFNADRVMCVYQPILDLQSGRIHGCEVLARWRDVDDATVFPDKFLPVVERNGLTRQLTSFVVQRAFAELSTLAFRQSLQVSFNVEPADLEASWLHHILSQFDAESDRFKVIVEIVESDAVDPDKAQREIDLLRRHGIKTDLDDFGTGYSNIQNLATLALDGVKLDRSFAMAAPGSLMESMMFKTIEMIHAAGHRITVEGVETEARLHDLRATGQVHHVQGYLISRPLGIDNLEKFLANAEPVAWRPRLVA